MSPAEFPLEIPDDWGKHAHCNRLTSASTQAFPGCTTFEAKHSPCAKRPSADQPQHAFKLNLCCYLFPQPHAWASVKLAPYRSGRQLHLLTDCPALSGGAVFLAAARLGSLRAPDRGARLQVIITARPQMHAAATAQRQSVAGAALSLRYCTLVHSCILSAHCSHCLRGTGSHRC
jgi:hypothetical protein